MPFCTVCGAPLFPDARFCTECGTEVRSPSSNVYVFALSHDESDPNYSVDFFEVELVGEARHEDAFVEVLGRLSDEEEAELDDVTSVLVREPKHPDDVEDVVVAVYVADETDHYHRVGYLSPDDAEEYLETIKELERRTGRHVGCLAGVRGKGRVPGFALPVYSVRIYLPEPGEWLRWKLSY